MSEVRHTPGPWRVDLRDDGVYRVDAQDGDGWRFVAVMLGENQQANAHLIARAWKIPELEAQRDELLEAAKNVLARNPEFNLLRAAVTKVEEYERS